MGGDLLGQEQAPTEGDAEAGADAEQQQVQIAEAASVAPALGRAASLRRPLGGIGVPRHLLAYARRAHASSKGPRTPSPNGSIRISG
jgi:hypothetical protein